MTTNNQLVDSELNAITTRLQPGINGISFLKACAESDKPLRKVFGYIVVNSYNDLMVLRGKKSMAVAFFDDVPHVQAALNGSSEIELGLSEIPEQILASFAQESKEATFDNTAVITVVLKEAKVSFTARIWLDKDRFTQT